MTGANHILNRFWCPACLLLGREVDSPASFEVRAARALVRCDERRVAGSA
jgi:hypothetical protein